MIPSTIAGRRAAGAGKHWRLDRAAAKRKIAQARKDLAAAERLDGGRLPALTLHLPGRDASTKKSGEFIKARFAAVGVDLKVVATDWPLLQKMVHDGTCQMFTMGWHADYPDAENFLQLFYSPHIKAGTNNSRYADAEYDKLFEQARVMPDSPRRTALYAKMAQIVAEDCPVLLLAEAMTVTLHQPWLLNVKPHPIAYGSAKYWRIDPARRRAAATRRATSGPK